MVIWAPVDCMLDLGVSVFSAPMTSNPKEPPLDREPMGRATLTALQGAYLASRTGAWYRFRRAAGDPERAQLALLRRCLEPNVDTAYGRDVGLGRITSAAAYQDLVPAVDYDALDPWIQRIAAGEGTVLTREPVRMLERSGGSTATTKLIPYTDGLLDQFGAATGPWIFDLHVSRPALIGARSYWSVSQAARRGEQTAGGVPIGFEDDTEYFGPLARWALRQLQAVPREVVRLPTIEAWRTATLTHLLAADDLALISVWSPTFLTRLMEGLAEDLEQLLAAIPAARAAAVRRSLDAAGALTGAAIWPRLDLVSCWSDGAAAGFISGLRRWFPDVAIQPKGLLATEGVVSFPLWGHAGGVLAVTSHFLEFVELEAEERRPLLAHQLRPEGLYTPLLTTAGGLYRYRLKDIIRCVGRFRGTPLIRFEGKLDRVSDLCGEKVNARQVDHVLERCRERLGVAPRFALLAPVQPPDGEGRPRYRLYLEWDEPPGVLEQLAAEVEAYLATGHHYRYCRDLGQLDPVEPRRIRDGWRTYERTLVGLGQRAGDIKPTHLDHRLIWDEAFGEPDGG